MATVVKEIPTAAGIARSHFDRPPGDLRAVLVLGHGAGGSVGAADLLVLRQVALQQGIAVARIEQPYKVAGRKAPAPAAQLDLAWTEAVRVTRLRRRGLPLIVGGRSSGARVACRTAETVGADAVVVLAFPLHWPGNPEKTRLAELDLVTVPVLGISGERDPFGVPPEDPRRTLCVLPGRVHGLKGPKQPIVDAFTDWLETLPVLARTDPPPAGN